MGNLSDSKGPRDGMFIISTTEPTAPPPTNPFQPFYSGLMAWYNPEEEELKIWDGTKWEKASVKNHKGENANIEINGKTAKFKKGILVSYE